MHPPLCSLFCRFVVLSTPTILEDADLCLLIFETKQIVISASVFAMCLVSKMKRHKSASSSIVGVDKTTKRQNNEQSGGCICRRSHPGFVVGSASSAVSTMTALGETRLVLASKTPDRGPGRTACIYSESGQAVLGLGFGLVGLVDKLVSF